MLKLPRLNLRGSKCKLHLPNGMIIIYFQRLINITKKVDVKNQKTFAIIVQQTS